MTPELAAELREIAEAIEEADGITPLRAGEMRPLLYYAPRHYTTKGRKPLWPSKERRKQK